MREVPAGSRAVGGNRRPEHERRMPLTHRVRRAWWQSSGRPGRPFSERPPSCGCSARRAHGTACGHGESWVSFLQGSVPRRGACPAIVLCGQVTEQCVLYGSGRAHQILSGRRSRRCPRPHPSRPGSGPADDATHHGSRALPCPRRWLRHARADQQRYCALTPSHHPGPVRHPMP